MTSLTDGKTAGVNLQSRLDRDGDGDTDMQDLIKMFPAAADKQSLPD